MPEKTEAISIYHNPRCSKSRQTLQLIVESGIQPEVIEYLVDTPSEKELKALIAMLCIDAEELVRKGEEDYKTRFKGKKLTESEWIAAMVSNPKLIERPIVVKGKKAILGRPPEKVLELL